MSQPHYVDTETTIDQTTRIMQLLSQDGSNSDPILKNPRQMQNLEDYIGMGCPEILNCCLLGVSVYDDARYLLGDDFITPEEMFMEYSSEEVERLQSSLPNIDFLQKCKERGHVLLPGPPKKLNLAEVRYQSLSHFNSQKQYLLNGLEQEEFFYEEVVSPMRWMTVHKGLIKSETNCSAWSEMRYMISRDEYVPNAAELAWMLTAFLSVRKVFLIEENRFAHTSSYCAEFEGVLYMGRRGDQKIRVGRRHSEEVGDRHGFICSLEM